MLGFLYEKFAISKVHLTSKFLIDELKYFSLAESWMSQSNYLPGNERVGSINGTEFLLVYLLFRTCYFRSHLEGYASYLLSYISCDISRVNQMLLLIHNYFNPLQS